VDVGACRVSGDFQGELCVTPQKNFNADNWFGSILLAYYILADMLGSRVVNFVLRHK
jgi:hypothetical protein